MAPHSLGRLQVGPLVDELLEKRVILSGRPLEEDNGHLRIFGEVLKELVSRGKIPVKVIHIAELDLDDGDRSMRFLIIFRVRIISLKHILSSGPCSNSLRVIKVRGKNERIQIERLKVRDKNVDVGVRSL